MASDRERFSQAEQIFMEICDVPASARAARLRDLGEEDAELARLVRRMLAADDDPLVETDGFDLRAHLDCTPTETPVRRIAQITVPGFKIAAVIGEGGMGVVYRAVQDRPHREVALKLLRPGVVTPDTARRFDLEAEVLGRLRHPGIAQIYEVGTTSEGAGGHPYFAMEYIRGAPITEYARVNDLSTNARVELLARVCDAIDYAHECGVIHRDLKPANILVDEHGAPRVLDFGVARMTSDDATTITLETSPGQLIGTLPYMSPEQVSGSRTAIDSSCDVYALGALLYELLTDRLPLDVLNTSIADAARIIREEEPTRLALVNRAFRGDLDTIVNKALEKDKTRRYLSAGAFGADLRRYLGSEPIEAHPPTTFYQLRKFARRHRTFVGGVTATFIVLLVGIVSTTIVAFDAHDNAERATASAHEATFGLYRSRIAAAQASLALGDPLGAQVHLEAAPEALRQWEWLHLSAQADPVLARVEIDPGLGREVCAFALDGTPLLLEQRDGEIVVVDLQRRGNVIHRLGTNMTMRAALAPNGQAAAIIDNETNALRVWSFDENRSVPTFSVPLPSGASTVDDVHFSRDASTIAVIVGPRILVVDARGSAPVVECNIPDLRRARLSPDGGRVAYLAGSYVGIADCATGHKIQRAQIDITPDNFDFDIAPDGRTLAIGLGQYARRVALLDTESLDDRDQLIGHSASVGGVRYSQDGHRLASVAKGSLLVHAVDSGEVVSSCNVGRSVHPHVLRVDATERRYILVATEGEQSVALLIEPMYQPARELIGHETYVYQLAFDRSGKRIVSVDYDSNILVWDLATGTRSSAHEGRSRQCIAFTESGDAIVNGNLWIELSTGRRRNITDSRPGGGAGPPTAVSEPLAGGVVYEGGAISSDGMWFVGGGRVVQSVATGEVVMTLEAQAPMGTLAVAFGPRRRLIAFGRRDGVVEIHDLETRTLLNEIDAHTSTVYSVNFSPDGSRLVSGGNDNTVRLFDVESGEQMIELRGHLGYVHCVAFSPDGTLIASASGDGTIRVWDSMPRSRRMTEALGR